MSIILPCRSEFGLKLRYHVPAVHALGPGHWVYVEPGEEALYPLASRWIEVERRHDDDRHGWDDPEKDRIAGALNCVEVGKGDPQSRFIPEPHVPRGITADVVICPRKRRYGADKNWDGWELLAELPGAFAAGAPDSSYDVTCDRAWDYDRFLDASIEAMRSARLVVATDAGLAHLAVLCGTPLLLITHDGLVAPGPVSGSEGHVLEPAYWPVRLHEYYQQANHTDSPIHVSGAFQDPDTVLEEIRDILNT